MKTLLSLIFVLSSLSAFGQGGQIIRTPLTTNQMMNSPTDGWSVIWNDAAKRWSNVLFAASATNAQPPSTVLSNLASYGINYALSNIITVNATPNILTNGILLTNAVKEAGTLASGTRNMLVLLTPGKYLTPTNTLPSVMMAVDNVSTYWMPGSIWSSGTSNAAADEAYMWDDNAGKRTNVNVYGWGRFFCSNLIANPLILNSGSRMFFESLSMDAENSCFTLGITSNNLTMNIREEMHSEGYDAFYFSPSEGHTLNLRAGKIRSAHGDIFEFGDDAPQWGQVVVEADVLERSGIGSGNPSFLQPGGRCIVRAKAIINRDPAASIYVSGTVLTNSLIEGAVIQHPDNASVSILQDTSIGSVAHTGLWLKNCILYGPTNRDAFTLTNRAFLPTRFDNCTVFNGWAATNWVRGKTPSAVAVSGLVIEGPNSVGENITFTRTNTFANIRNYGTLTVDSDTFLSGITTNGILYSGASGQVRTAALSGLTFSGGTLTATPGGTPGGAFPMLQYQDTGGAFAGTTNLTWDSTNSILGLYSSSGLGVMRLRDAGAPNASNELSSQYLRTLNGYSLGLGTHGSNQWNIVGGTGPIGSVLPAASNVNDVGSWSLPVRTNYANDFVAIETVRTPLLFSAMLVTTPFTNYSAIVGSPATNILIDAGLGNIFRTLLTNNMGLMLTNGYDGQELSIELYQDGTGNRTVTHVPNTGGALTNNWQFGEDITSPITLTTNQYKMDMIKLRYQVINLATNTSRSNWCVIGMLRKYPN